MTQVCFCLSKKDPPGHINLSVTNPLHMNAQDPGSGISPLFPMPMLFSSEQYQHLKVFLPFKIHDVTECFKFNSSTFINFHIQSLVKNMPVFTNGNNSLLKKFAHLPDQLILLANNAIRICLN